MVWKINSICINTTEYSWWTMVLSLPTITRLSLVIRVTEGITMPHSWVVLNITKTNLSKKTLSITEALAVSDAKDHCFYKSIKCCMNDRQLQTAGACVGLRKTRLLAVTFTVMQELDRRTRSEPEWWYLFHSSWEKQDIFKSQHACSSYQNTLSTVLSVLRQQATVT